MFLCVLIGGRGFLGEGLGSIATRCSGSEPALTPSSFLGEENRARGSGGNGS